MAPTLQKATTRQRSGWIPWAFVGAFVVVAAVNALLAVEASRSWTGVVTETPFDTGNDYNRVVAQTKQEASLGWKVDAQTAHMNDGKVLITVVVGDQPGSGGATDIRGSLLRPMGMEVPVPLTFQETATGHFEAIVKLPEVGNWDLHLQVRGKTGSLHTTRRLFVS
jgi:nitrogen fixation protein FixH